jgi:hypothetical protein
MPVNAGRHELYTKIKIISRSNANSIFPSPWNASQKTVPVLLELYA